jgi:hypothetical protein
LEERGGSFETSGNDEEDTPEEFIVYSHEGFQFLFHDIV